MNVSLSCPTEIWIRLFPSNWSFLCILIGCTLICLWGWGRGTFCAENPAQSSSCRRSNKWTAEVVPSAPLICPRVSISLQKIIRHCNKSFHSIYRWMKICTTECNVTQLFKGGNMSRLPRTFFPEAAYSELQVVLPVPFSCQPHYLELHPFPWTLIICQGALPLGVSQGSPTSVSSDLCTNMANTDLLCVGFDVKDWIS